MRKIFFFMYFIIIPSSANSFSYKQPLIEILENKNLIKIKCIYKISNNADSLLKLRRI